MGLVECPACKTEPSSSGCELCDGEGYVGVDASIAWREARDSLPSIGTAAVTAEEITLLLDNVDMVLRAVATMPTSAAARALADRALARRDDAKAFETATPTRVAYDALTGRVLGLHIALRKLKEQG